MRQTHWKLFTVMLTNTNVNIHQVLEEAQARTIKVMIVVKLKERQRAKHFPFLTVFFSKAESTFMLTNINLIG